MAKLKLTCPSCDRPFEKYASQITGRQTYCSLKCSAAAKKNGSWLDCARCGSSFYRRFGEQDLDVRQLQFCSRPCYMAHRDEHRGDTYPRVGPDHLHRLVAERVLGRNLLLGEIVHHIDEDKANAAPSNLAVFPDQATHARCHFGVMSDDELRGFSLAEAASRSTRRD
jgi:hypothetical protein